MIVWWTVVLAAEIVRSGLIAESFGVNTDRTWNYLNLRKRRASRMTPGF